MFCHNCGNEIKTGEKFCKNCGQPVITNDFLEKQQNNSKCQEEEGVSCPYCGSKDYQVVVKTEVKGGGYSASSGCCGFLLLGPLGLLCGACGSDVKSSSETWWNCKKCGKEFLSTQATWDKLKKGVNSSLIWSLVCSFFSAACLAMDEDQVVCVIPAAIAAFLWYSVSQIPEKSANTSLKDFIGIELYQKITSRYIWIGIVTFVLLTIMIKNLLWG